MPFKIVQNDITLVKADVIVNSANPDPIYDSGTDYAIYKAAGEKELLAERKTIGCIRQGDIAVTNAYALAARYIIHTVGPEWVDGKHKEFETLENCYAKSLQKALELGCTSIAFPLISTGVYGFPKDKALQIAVSEFSRFLLENDMQIILVVFDKKSFQLSAQLIGEIDSFIDSNSLKKKQLIEYSRRALTHTLIETDIIETDNSFSKNALTLEEELENVGMSFHDKLFELIANSGMDNKDVWKRANLDRKHFSKIQCDEKYHPKKKTVLALCISLRLNLTQAEDLLARAEWAFSPSSKFDLIVKKAIIDNQYDINQLNLVLFQYTNEVLGV